MSVCGAGDGSFCELALTSLFLSVVFMQHCLQVRAQRDLDIRPGASTWWQPLRRELITHRFEHDCFETSSFRGNLGRCGRSSNANGTDCTCNFGQDKWVICPLSPCQGLLRQFYFPKGSWHCILGNGTGFKEDASSLAGLQRGDESVSWGAQTSSVYFFSLQELQARSHKQLQA